MMGNARLFEDVEEEAKDRARWGRDADITKRENIVRGKQMADK
jgi:hypothetical protein